MTLTFRKPLKKNFRTWIWYDRIPKTTKVKYSFFISRLCRLNFKRKTQEFNFKTLKLKGFFNNQLRMKLLLIPGIPSRTIQLRLLSEPKGDMFYLLPSSTTLLPLPLGFSVWNYKYYNLTATLGQIFTRFFKEEENF